MNRDTGAISPASREEDVSASRAIACDDQNPRTEARREHDLLAAIAGLFVNDSFAEEVDAYIQAERQRERTIDFQGIPGLLIEDWTIL